MPHISTSLENVLTDSSASLDNDGKTPTQEDNNYNRNKFKQLFKPFLRDSYQPPSENAAFKERLKHAFLCPPAGKLAQYITLIFIIFLLWGLIWSILKKPAEPGGYIFSLYILTVLCLIGGWLISFIKLPPLLGMLLVGVALRNIPYINIIGINLDKTWSSTLRTVALVVILTRTGLGLDPIALNKLKAFCFRLAFLPCLAEAITAGILAHYILHFDWIWGFLLGFVLTAVSPAVVVPLMLLLQQKGLGVDQGIPTIIMAASSLDDVLAICVFSILLGIAFSTGDLVFTIFHGPIEIIIGILYGFIFGFFAWYIPSKYEKNTTFYRFIILFGGALFAAFGSRKIEFSGAGPLGCILFVFIAAIGWRQNALKEKEQITNIMTSLWVVFQPVLFGLIGAEIDIATLEGKTVGLGLIVMSVSLCVRWFAALLSTIGNGFTKKENFFISIARLPKATVQAAIGSLALDTARDKHASKDIQEVGLKILTIAVLEILITAPLGAIAISLSAPRLLSRAETHTSKSKETEDNVTYL